MRDHALKSTEAVKSLAGRLSNVPEITRLSAEGHNEPWTLAHSLSDIADASEAYLRALPALTDSTLEGDELLQELIQLTTHLQHMLYHLEDPRFLADIFAPLRVEWVERRANR